MDAAATEEEVPIPYAAVGVQAAAAGEEASVAVNARRTGGLSISISVSRLFWEKEDAGDAPEVDAAETEEEVSIPDAAVGVQAAAADEEASEAVNAGRTGELLIPSSVSR